MSQHKIIDNRGLSCPLPVVNTKKIIDELTGSDGGFTLISLVDNETAAENVSRFARGSGCEVRLEKKEDGIYVYIIKKEKTPSTDKKAPKSSTESELLVGACPEGPGTGTVMLFTSDTLGRGNEELGKLLMRSFIFTLQESETPPAKMLFLNSGVNLTVQDSPVLEELQDLARRGVEIYSCGTCLDYYKLKDKLMIGCVTNMYDTVEAMLGAGRCITV